MSAAASKAPSPASSLASSTAPSTTPIYYKSNLLPELVKAIKFAFPDYGLNKIHAHITKTHLPDLKKEYDDDERQEGLKGAYRNATKGEVKKLYKTLSLSNHAMGVTGNEYVPDPEDMEKVVDNTGKGLGKMHVKEDDGVDGIGDEAATEKAKTKIKSKEVGKSAAQKPDPGTIHLFTVGSSTVPPPPPSSADQPAISSASLDSGESSKQVNVGLVQLNVPGDKSGTKPHQAVIEYTPPGNSGSGGGGKGNGKKAGKKKKKAGEWDVFKIQSIDNSMTKVLLMYDETKTHKTFIHPDPEEGSVYKIIHRLVILRGIIGKLGPTGGRKVYMRGRVIESGKFAEIILDDAEGIVVDDSVSF
ncbi:hypothetical protein TrVE_jg4538 [Triparma verrucosa]|uniref:Uncharacterized protein n=1 Tax=Triparma verrucosa TaxID=1606542 RepID=A0A9W7C2A4_9STRA|nr:hypothetical protein TrVE_jg4538 [Triparma verrucosa]